MYGQDSGQVDQLLGFGTCMLMHPHDCMRPTGNPGGSAAPRYFLSPVVQELVHDKSPLLKKQNRNQREIVTVKAGRLQIQQARALISAPLI